MKIEHEESSGNVFADIGLEDANEQFLRSEVGVVLFRLLKATGLTQVKLGEMLGIKQPEVSHLMNGHFDRFTLDALFAYLVIMGQRVEIRISPRRSASKAEAVVYTPRGSQLSEEETAAILAAKGKESAIAVAERFGVTRSWVHQLWRDA